MSWNIHVFIKNIGCMIENKRIWENLIYLCRHFNDLSNQLNDCKSRSSRYEKKN